MMTKFRWWRVTGIQVRDPVKDTLQARGVATLDFINTDNIPCNIPDYGFSNSDFNSTYDYRKAFDSNPATFAHNNYEIPEHRGILWSIGYQFPEAVQALSIGVQMRPDIADRSGTEWVSASVESSLDGLIWEHYGVINPDIGVADASYTIAPITLQEDFFKKLTVTAFDTGETGIVSKSILNFFSGYVTSGVKVAERVPVITEVMLYDKFSKKLVQTTKSDAAGFFEFKYINPDKAYYAVAVHPKAEYNSIITDVLILN